MSPLESRRKRLLQCRHRHRRWNDEGTFFIYLYLFSQKKTFPGLHHCQSASLSHSSPSSVQSRCDLSGGIPLVKRTILYILRINIFFIWLLFEILKSRLVLGRSGCFTRNHSGSLGSRGWGQRKEGGSNWSSILLHSITKGWIEEHVDKGRNSVEELPCDLNGYWK